MHTTYSLSMIQHMGRTQAHVHLKVGNSFVQRWYWNWKTTVTSHDKSTWLSLCTLLYREAECGHKEMVLCCLAMVTFTISTCALNTIKCFRKHNKWSQIALLTPLMEGRLSFEPIQNCRAVSCKTTSTYGLKQTLKHALATLVLPPHLMDSLQ